MFLLPSMGISDSDPMEYGHSLIPPSHQQLLDMEDSYSFEHSAMILFHTELETPFAEIPKMKVIHSPAVVLRDEESLAIPQAATTADRGLTNGGETQVDSQSMYPPGDSSMSGSFAAMDACTQVGTYEYDTQVDSQTDSESDHSSNSNIVSSDSNSKFAQIEEINPKHEKINEDLDFDPLGGEVLMDVLLNYASVSYDVDRDEPTDDITIGAKTTASIRVGNTELERKSAILATPRSAARNSGNVSAPVTAVANESSNSKFSSSIRSQIETPLNASKNENVHVDSHSQTRSQATRTASQIRSLQAMSSNCPPDKPKKQQRPSSPIHEDSESKQTDHFDGNPNINSERTPSSSIQQQKGIHHDIGRPGASVIKSSSKISRKSNLNGTSISGRNSMISPSSLVLFHNIGQSPVSSQRQPMTQLPTQTQTPTPSSSHSHMPLSLQTSSRKSPVTQTQSTSEERGNGMGSIAMGLSQSTQNSTFVLESQEKMAHWAHEYIGCSVKKYFQGYGDFFGTVLSFRE